MNTDGDPQIYPRIFFKIKIFMNTDSDPDLYEYGFIRGSG